MTRSGWLVSLLLLAALLLAACQPVTPAQAADDGCSVEGAWIGSFEGGPWDTKLVLQSTLTPLDPDGERLAYVMRLVNGDATFRIPGFEEADYLSELVGEAAKSEAGTYDVSLISYGVKEREGDRNEVLYIFALTGTVACVEDALIQDVVISVFAADQDADGDGFPDEGAEPIVCNPSGVGTGMKRIPFAPWCEPVAE